MLRLLAFLLKTVFATILSIVCIVGGINLWIYAETAPEVYDSPELVPFNAVGMVLGTSNRTRSGAENQHFLARMDAAASLYHSGKVQHLILSGDNMTPYYDEPKMMKVELISRGIPDYSITLDTAGFRTLESVARLKEVFGVNTCTIISERYHIYRALFISRRYGLDAIGYAAPDVAFGYGLRSRSREVLARVKAVIDLYLLPPRNERR